MIISVQAAVDLHLRSVINAFCHTLASQHAAVRFHSSVGIRDRTGAGRIGRVNYGLTRRSILGVSQELHEGKKWGIHLNDIHSNCV